MTDASLSSVIERDASLLLLVDLQEKLLRAVRDHERVVARCALLLQAAARLNVPVLATEQYAKGIGATHPALAALLPPNAVMDKIHFSCVAEADCTRRIAAEERRQIVICGTEAHVCVQQSALGLKQSGYDVFLAADATGSRKEEDKILAFERMRGAGIVAVSAEMVVFEWLARADTEAFRDILPLIKADVG